MGYRRIRDELDGHKGIHVNDKRVLRICRKYDIKSNIKWKPKSCTRGDRNPDHIAKNYLHREFHAEKPNEKWLTDVSEFKYYNGAFCRVQRTPMRFRADAVQSTTDALKQCIFSYSRGFITTV